MELALRPDRGGPPAVAEPFDEWQWLLACLVDNLHVSTAAIWTAPRLVSSRASLGSACDKMVLPLLAAMDMLPAWTEAGRRENPGLAPHQEAEGSPKVEIENAGKI